MPRLPFPHRPGRPDPAQLDALLRPGSSGPVGTEWQGVSEVLQAAAAPAAPSELAGEAAMLAAFRRAQLGTDGAPARRRLLERPRMLTTMLTGKLAAVLAAAAVGATGAATAAYAGVLPDSVQNLAHHLIAAPAPNTDSQASADLTAAASTSASPSPSPSPSPSVSASPSPSPSASVSPSPSPSPSPSAASSQAPEAFGLCTAWSNAVRHGLQDQVGFRDKLAKIAGGDDSVDSINTFCASVKHPSDDGSESPESTASDSASADIEGQDSNGGHSSHDGEQHGKSGEQHGHGHGGVSLPSLAPIG